MNDTPERFVTVIYETASGGVTQKRYSGAQPDDELPGYRIYPPDDVSFPNMIKIWGGTRTFWVPRERLIALEMNL